MRRARAISRGDRGLKPSQRVDTLRFRGRGPSRQRAFRRCDCPLGIHLVGGVQDRVERGGPATDGEPSSCPHAVRTLSAVLRRPAAGTRGSPHGISVARSAGPRPPLRTAVNTLSAVSADAANAGGRGPPPPRARESPPEPRPGPAKRGGGFPAAPFRRSVSFVLPSSRPSPVRRHRRPPSAFLVTHGKRRRPPST
jgi:hypothetical protein